MSRILLPEWLRKTPAGNLRNMQINRFYIRLAALYATEDGRLTSLATLIGVEYPTLKKQSRSIVRASRETKEGIRKILGDNFVPPDLPELHRLPKKKDAR